MQIATQYSFCVAVFATHFFQLNSGPVLYINACVRVADVMIFTFVSLMPVHKVCRICKIINE